MITDIVQHPGVDVVDWGWKGHGQERGKRGGTQPMGEGMLCSRGRGRTEKWGD
jgi:hypothetical protein